MKKVKYIWNRGDNRLGLIANMIYNVVYEFNDIIEILDSYGIVRTYYLSECMGIYFIDATAEYRDEVINEILE